MIPYNPSSFNSNKTILEQILELKNWLINHPQYEVYYCNDNASLYPFMNTFSLADVPDNTNMDVGDLVVCNNAVYCTVISIDRDNGVFTAGYGVSFKGDTGATGQQGYSLRVSSENYADDVTAYHRNSLEPSHGTRENDTIIFANGYVGIVTSLGAGATYYVTNRTVSFVGPQGPQGPTGPEGPEGPTGATGPQGVSITNVAIDGNDHLIVTLSDGSTIDAGSVSSGGGANVVTLSATSGTLTPEELATLQNDDSVIIYNGGYYKKHYSDNSSMTFVRIYNAGGATYERRFDITNSTRAYSHTQVYLPVNNNNIKSIGATAGQVLQADGSGGASWQNAGGIDVVNISSSSGTLSIVDLNKLQGDNCILCRTDTGRYYYKIHETTTELTYMAVERSNSSTTAYRVLITILTSSYTSASTSYPITMSPTTASNGQVLTADGNGGCGWQTHSGKYLHTVKFLNSLETQYCISHFITSSSASLTKSDIISILNTVGATSSTSMYHFNEMGYIDITNTPSTLDALVMGIYTSSSSIYARIVKLDGTYNTYNISNGTFDDTVAQL